MLLPKGGSVLCIVVTIAAGYFAQDARADSSLYSEKGKLIRANEAVTTHGADLMGDQVNLYHGALEFLQTDVSLPGNNALPVSISRRFSANQEGFSSSQFVDWDLEMPHIRGVFSGAQGFVGQGGFSRCTNYGVPPNVLAGQGGGAYFSASEYWHGNFLHTAGGGQQEILKRAPTNTLQPADGQTYPLVTKDWWSIRCIPLSGTTGTANEGFLAVAPDGTQYRFDVLVERPYPLIVKSSASTAPNSQTSTNANGGVISINGVAGYSLTRKEVRILPSLVTDRYGNTVTYTYDAADQWRLTNIQASDGRNLLLTYEAASHRISTVTDGTRTWTYTYTDLTPAQKVLSSLTLPDASRWYFNLNGLRTSVLDFTGTSETCGQENTVGGGSYSGSITHPSGAVGDFVVSSFLHGRSLVTKNCVTDISNGSDYSYFALSFARFSLTSKKITGPGLPAMTWSYVWGPTNSSFDPCAGCEVTKTVLVTDPKGDVTRYTYGNRFRVSEGQLQKIDVGWNAATGTALRTTTMRNRLPISTAGPDPYPQIAGQSQQTRGDGEMASQFTPEDQRIITQQGASFKWEVAAGAAGYDFQARPISVTRSSPYGTRTEATTFFDVPSKWILGQIANVTESSTGKLIAENTFNPTTANLETKKEFGRLVETIAYNTDGTIYARADGLGQTNTYTNYKRGLAQNVTYADGKTESAIVNDIGLISSVTNAASQTTSYGYDAIGRLSSITPPGADTTAWNATYLTFAPVGVAEYGIGAGHWKQTTTTGNAVTINYFDGLWRRVFTRTYDSAAETATRRVTLRKFDFKGRSVFESFPKRDITDVNTVADGTSKAYDTLGRMSSVQTNSELGLLTSTNSYVANFQKQTTDPRGNTTTTSYQAFDEPSEDRPVRITAPEGVTVNFARDVFGKATSISRSGIYNGGTISAVRSYVYDGYERLCKTIEPETGASIMDYDAANNVTWRATGVALNSTGSCDQAAVPAARKVTFTYDARNRLINTSYADGSPAIARTYTPDGLPETLKSGNADWTYSYNKRRLLTSESLTVVTP